MSREALDARLLPGFERRIVEVDGRTVNTLVGGRGDPILMLHGDPQTHLCWHHIAPTLAENHTVVLTDIRGRGDTHKPAATADSSDYSKRNMAIEQLGVMEALGFPRFHLIGHDRGGRVSRRMALDHQESVRSLVVMDIVPELDFYENSNAAIAQDYFYFFFLTQPCPTPEELIGGSPQSFMRQMLCGLSEDQVPYDQQALDAYVNGAAEPESIVAMCECFRAGLHIDRVHDQIDVERGTKIKCPSLVMWGEKGIVGKHFDIKGIWRRWCADVTFAPMPAGHFIPEEAPKPALDAIIQFLASKP